MTALEFVKENLQREYGEEAVARMEVHMEEMLRSDVPVEGELNMHFQKALDENLYPFLACMKAMGEVGIPAKEVKTYCQELSEAFFEPAHSTLS